MLFNLKNVESVILASKRPNVFVHFYLKNIESVFENFLPLRISQPTFNYIVNAVTHFWKKESFLKKKSSNWKNSFALDRNFEEQKKLQFAAHVWGTGRGRVLKKNPLTSIFL